MGYRGCEGPPGRERGPLPFGGRLYAVRPVTTSDEARLAGGDPVLPGVLGRRDLAPGLLSSAFLCSTEKAYTQPMNPNVFAVDRGNVRLVTTYAEENPQRFGRCRVCLQIASNPTQQFINDHNAGRHEPAEREIDHDEN